MKTRFLAALLVLAACVAFVLPAEAQDKKANTMKQVIENGRIPGFGPFIFFQQVLEAMSTESSERNSEKNNDSTEADYSNLIQHNEERGRK